MSEQYLMEARDVSRVFAKRGRELYAVRHLSLGIRPGECLGIVGESGSGKSTLGRMLSSLLRPTSGEILYRGTPLSECRKSEGRGCYRHVQVVFQEPISAFSPRMNIGKFVSRGLVHFHLARRGEIRTRTVELLNSVGLSESFMERLPHQMSGGELQRAVIARAISVNPDVLVLDEATSALDVSVQKQILSLLWALREETGITYVMISHDLALVRQYADRVGVMFGGVLVEVLSPALLKSPAAHPYTHMLLSHMLNPGSGTALPEVEELAFATDVSEGQCPFAPMCREAGEACAHWEPGLKQIGEGHYSTCVNRF